MKFSVPDKIRSVLIKALLAAAIPGGIWCLGILCFVVFPEKVFLALFSAAVLFSLIAASFFYRPLLWGVWGIEGALLIYFACLTPAMQFKGVKWQSPWARRPQAVFLDNRKIRFTGVRDFLYRSEKDFTPRYCEMVVSIEDIQHIDLALSHWDGMESVAHTMLGMQFSDGQYLCLSLETRLPEGKEQSAIGGLFKQYELIPLLGTRRDIFDLRIKHRGEDFYLYRTTLSKEQSQQLLVFLARNLKRPPEFYNTLTHNCSTALDLFLHIAGSGPVDDIRLLFNGFSDQLLFELGYLRHRRGESFASLKSRSFIPGKSAGIADEKE